MKLSHEGALSEEMVTVVCVREIFSEVRLFSGDGSIVHTGRFSAKLLEVIDPSRLIGHRGQSSRGRSKMGGLTALLYGIVSYLMFLASFLYAIAFVGNIGHVPGFPNLVIPKTIDSGISGSVVESIIVDLLLLSIFAVQHSLMARPAFKRVWTKIVPVSVERSTYVLLSSLALALVYWQWRPLPDPAWTITNSVAVLVLNILFWIGWGIVLISTFLQNHFELFGLSQVWTPLRGSEVPVINVSHATLLQVGTPSDLSRLHDCLLVGINNEPRPFPVRHCDNRLHVCRYFS